MTWSHPLWALLVLPALAAVWVRELRLEATPARRRARLGVRTLALLALGAALAGPGLTWRSVPVSRLLVAVDCSAGMPPAGRAEAAQALEAEVGRTAAGEAAPLVLGFAEEASGVVDLAAALAAGWPRAAAGAGAAPEPPPARGARVGAALLAARACFARGETGRVLLLVSATTDLEGLDAWADELGRAALALEVRVLPAARADERPRAEVRRLSAPTGAVRGAFAVRADVAAPPGWTARLLADGRVLAENVLAAAGPGAAPGEPRDVLFDGLELSPGRHLLALALVPPPAPEGAPEPALEPAVLALAEVEVEARPRVVMVLADPERDPLRRAASAQGFEIEVVAPEALAARLAEGAPPCQALALDAASARVLPGALSERVAQLVERGLGLFLVAGEAPDAWGALAGTPLGVLLPLEPLAAPPPEPPPPRPPPPTPPPPPVEPPEPTPGPGLKAERQPEEALPISLLLVLDRSGSMRGAPWGMAVEAAVRAAEVLSPFDRVGVVTFGEDARVELAMGPVRTAGSMALHLPAEADGRGTHLVAGLRKAAEVMRGEKAPIKHVLLLTDGYHNPTGTRSEQALWSAVVKPLAALGVTLTAVGLGEGHDARTLSEIVHWVPRGHYRRADHPGQVPTIFIVDAQGIAQRRSKDARARLPDPEAPPALPVPERTPPPPTPEPPPPTPPPTPPAPQAPAAPRLAPLRLGRPHPALKGFAEADLPQVEAPMRSGPRAGGVVLLEREPGEAVLAARRYGVGRVLVLAAHAKDAGLAPWGDLGRLIGQGLRSLLAPEGTFQTGLKPRLLAGPDGDRLELSSLAEGSGRALAVRWRAQDEASRDLGRVQATPDAEPLALPTAERGSLAHVEVLDAQGGLLGSLTYVAGTARGGPDPAVQEAEVRRRLRATAPPAAPALREERVDLARWLLLLAVLLLPLDAWLHRYAFGGSRP